MNSQPTAHQCRATVDLELTIVCAQYCMTCSQQKYVDVDFTVIPQHPEMRNAEVETVVAQRQVPAQCFAPGLADKRQIVCAGRISRKHSLDEIAKAISSHADQWAQERLDHTTATGALPTHSSAKLQVRSKRPSFKTAIRVNIGGLMR